jgi:ABC-type sugar transport system ATPase subunit
MKDGKLVTSRPTEGLTEKELSMLMVGRDLKPADRLVDTKEEKAEFLKLEKLSGPGFDDIDISVSEGQIVTIAGLAGSGADEVLEAIFGVRPVKSGRMHLAGKRFAPRHVPDAMAAGVGMVPKERAVEGLIENHDISSNVGIVGLRRNAVAGFIDPRVEHRMAEEAIRQFHVKCQGPETPLRALSGGNKQKVLLAKWFMTQPQLVLLNNPTRGVDVGVKFEIYELIDKLRSSRPMAILMASEDMAEVVRISDVVVTMRHGRTSGVFSGDEITESNLIQAML